MSYSALQSPAVFSCSDHMFAVVFAFINGDSPMIKFIDLDWIECLIIPEPSIGVVAVNEHRFGWTFISCLSGDSVVLIVFRLSVYPTNF